MLESQTKNKLKKYLRRFYKPSEIEFINIHGSIYTPKGLPDLIIPTPDCLYWVEIKRDWNDKPKALQVWWIKRLRSFGFITGFVVGDKFKYSWTDEDVIFLPIKKDIN